MQKRRLTAIMFTDIQGFTALMRKSEDDALMQRSKHKEIFIRETEKHHGEILQYYGDGTLSVFESAVDAVICGIDIQRAMQEDPVVPLRIGIHSGDVIYTDDGIIGDGVNVASRIESLAVSGSVLISDKVFDEVKNSSLILTKFLKEYKLKNVERPIGVHVVTNLGLAIPDVKEITGKIERGQVSGGKLFKRFLVPAFGAILLIALLSFWFGSQWSNGQSGISLTKVAVVPLEMNAGGDNEDYLPVGYTDGLISELSKVDELTVMNQASTQFLAASMDERSPVVTNEMLGIDYFIEGSFSRKNNVLDVNMVLKASADGAPVYSKHYKRDVAEIRPLWAEVANDMASEMGIEVDPDDIARWSSLRPVNPDTYELYLKGRHYMNKSTPQDWQRGMVYFQEALDRNPADAYANAALAEGYVNLGHGPDPPPDVFPKALEYAERAIQLDTNLADGWAALCHYHTYFGWDWELAEYAFKRANALNPNLAWNHYHRAWYLALFGRMNEAIEEHKRARDLDPFTPAHTAWLGELYNWIGRYEDGLAEADKAIQLENDFGISLLVKGFIYRNQDRLEEAVEIHKQAGEINRGWRYIGYGPSLIRAGYLEEGRQVIKELESAPPSPFGALCLATMYSELGEFDKAFEWFNYEEKHGWYPWIRVMFVPEEMQQDPRYLKLIHDMNLPDPAPLVYDVNL